MCCIVLSSRLQQLCGSGQITKELHGRSAGVSPACKIAITRVYKSRRLEIRWVARAGEAAVAESVAT